VGTLPAFPRPFRAAKGAGMDKETRQNLLSCIAEIDTCEKQKKRFIQIHESYLRLLPLKVTKPGEICRECKDIENISSKYLKALRTPAQLSEPERKDFHLSKAYVKATVEAYRDLAKRCRLTYDGLGKRGRPGHWQKQIYIGQMARWYEEVRGRKACSGTDSVFPRILRSCFNQIASEEDELSDSLLKRVMKRYYDPETLKIRKLMEGERRRAIIRMKKTK
jgi:hypothetical protein